MFLVEITTFLCRQSPRFRHYFFGQITKTVPSFFSDWIMLNHLRSSLHINMNYNFYKKSDISPCLSLHVVWIPMFFCFTSPIFVATRTRPKHWNRRRRRNSGTSLGGWCGWWEADSTTTEIQMSYSQNLVVNLGSWRVSLLKNGDNISLFKNWWLGADY